MGNKNTTHNHTEFNTAHCFTVVKKEADSVEFKVALTKEESEIIDEKEFEELNIIVPGFRPGKAPLSMLRLETRKRMGNKAYKGMEESRLLKEATSIAIVNSDVALMDGTAILNGIEHNDDDVIINFFMDRDAEILTPPKFSTIKKTKIPKSVITDAFLENHMWNMYRDKADIEELDNTPATEEDLVTVSYGYVDGDKEDMHTLRVDMKKKNRASAPWIDIVLVQCKGAISGAVIKLENQTVPDNWPTEELRGKSMSLKIDVIKVERHVMDDKLSDDVAIDLGFSNLDEWKKMVLEDMQHTLKKINHESLRDMVSETLVSATEFHIPVTAMRKMLLKYVDRIVPPPQNEEENKTYQERLTSAYSNMVSGLEKEIESKKKGEELKDDAVLPIVEKEIAHRLIKKYIMEKWGKTPSYEDMKNEVYKMTGAKERNESVEERIAQFLDNESNADDVVRVLKLKTGLDIILSQHNDLFELFDKDLEIVNN